MSVPAVIEFGDTTFAAPGARFTRRRDGLDSGTLEWFNPSLAAYTPGDAPPGYSGLVIQEVEIEEDYPGRYVHRLQCLGVLGNKPNRRVKSVFRQTTDTFDEGNEEWIMLGQGLIAMGSTPAAHPTMVCVDRSEELLEAGFYHVTASYRGLLGARGYKRRISVNENIINPSEPVYLNQPGGWPNAALPSQFSLPKIVVQDSYVSTTPPNTFAIPGMLTPPNPPPIQNFYWQDSMDRIVFNWPWGWKLAGIDADNIPGSSIWATTYTYEFQWSVLPR
jgi:hypothetical protein